MSFQIAIFDPSEHVVSAFDCGHDDLNDWLIKNAAKDHQRGLCRVHVAHTPDSSEVMGYMALVTHTLQKRDLTKKMRAGAHGSDDRQLPALLLGKLAVDQSAQGTGLGSKLVDAAFQVALDIAENAGLLVVAVDVREDALFTYYQRHGFTRLGNSMTMAIPIAQIRANYAG